MAFRHMCVTFVYPPGFRPVIGLWKTSEDLYPRSECFHLHLVSYPPKIEKTISFWRNQGDGKF